MGNGGSRDAGDVATLRQGLELIGRWSLLLARKSPQLIDRWEQVEERIQAAEVDMEMLQDNVGTIVERLSRLEDREQRREARIAALEASVHKALFIMFPRVDSLLTLLEHTDDLNAVKVSKSVAEDYINNPVNSKSSKKKPARTAEVRVIGGKRKRQQTTKKGQKNTPAARDTASPGRSKSSASPPKRLARGNNTAAPTPSTSSANASRSLSVSHRASRRAENLEILVLSAVEDGKVEDMRSLLARGADVNTVNRYGQNLVALAASKGHTDCLSVLLEAGGDVDNCDRDRDGRLPLHTAALEGHNAILPLLLNAGANVNATTDPAAQTPLMLAASRGHHNCVSLLLESNADLDIQDNAGETALHKAVKEGSKESVSLLIDAGADVNIDDKFGRSPLFQAHQLRRKKIKKMLIIAGARNSI